MTRRQVAFPLAALAFVLAGCGGSGSNGEASKSAPAIFADAKQAARDAGSVRLVGEINKGGQRIGVDFRIGRHAGGGTMTVNGSKVGLLRVGRSIYIRGDPSFYRSLGAPASAIALLKGKWLKARATAKDFRNLAELTNVDSFVTQALTTTGTLSKGAKTSLDGREVIELKDSEGSVLFVAATGKPYPLEVSGTGTTRGSVTFSDWGAVSEPAAPKNVVDVSKLGG